MAECAFPAWRFGQQRGEADVRNHDRAQQCMEASLAGDVAIIGAPEYFQFRIGAFDGGATLAPSYAPQPIPATGSQEAAIP